MNSLFLVFIGGGLGSLLRFLISTLVLRLKATSNWFAVATLSANILACVVVALGMIYISKHASPDDLKLKNFLIIGFCGGLSTFSTFSLETLHMLQNGQPMHAIINVLLNLLFCGLTLWFIFKSVGFSG